MKDIKTIKNEVELTKDIILCKSVEQDKIFNDLIQKLNITDQDEREILFDYCYNNFESNLLEGILNKATND
jgi:hypothetical protein